MNSSANKPNYIIMIIGIIIFALGICLGFVLGINVNNNKIKQENLLVNELNIENTVQKTDKVSEYNPKLSKEERINTALSSTMTENEINELKKTVEKDETEYGDNYQEFTTYKDSYKRKPDRIYFKSSKIEGFYKFESDDENYKHLLEASEDRMTYSAWEDYNLYCFTPDSINNMMTSGDNYIIFDYDNENLSESNENFQKDLIFRFNANTRLFRLVTSLSYYKELILVEDLEKSEFATDTTISGYKYMTN